MSATVENWVSRLKPSSGKLAEIHLNLFMRWLKDDGGAFKDYTPDRLVECQKNADNRQRFEVLDLVQRHIQSLHDHARSSKTSRYTYLRSFFLHNRAELPRGRSFRIRGDRPTVRGDLTVDETKKLIMVMNLMFQAVYLCMLQGGMGAHEILYWNEHGLEKLLEDLAGNPTVIRIDLPGRKEGENERPFYTFIGSDAIVALKKWMPLRPKSSKVIFTTQDGAPLNYFSIQANWRRHMRRLGIGSRWCEVRGRTGKSPHELKCFALFNIVVLVWFSILHFRHLAKSFLDKT
ncbi:MAG: hypothetical protein V1850_01660 [Candidatus Bathyarchaeota archaeon]